MRNLRVSLVSVFLLIVGCSSPGNMMDLLEHHVTLELTIGYGDHSDCWGKFVYTIQDQPTIVRNLTDGQQEYINLVLYPGQTLYATGWGGGINSSSCATVLYVYPSEDTSKAVGDMCVGGPNITCSLTSVELSY